MFSFRKNKFIMWARISLWSYFSLLLIVLLVWLFILFDSTVKITRLKQAKEEAEKDVATYRSHLEAENQKRIAEVLCAYFVAAKSFLLG